MIDNYRNDFDARVSANLGGLDMATEFFTRHPAVVRKMRVATMYHFGKGGAACKGADIFFARTVRPLIVSDREACGPWPAKKPTIDDLDLRN